MIFLKALSIRLPARPSRGLHHFPPSYDRRRRTVRNRFRRFLNNYWLVPVFAVYLEFFAVALPSVDSPWEQLIDRNVSFVAGAGLLYDIVSHDFPHTLIGHGKEIVIHEKYAWGVGQVPVEYLIRAMSDSAEASAIHRRLLDSREDRTTEVGGVATLSQGPEGPRLHLYEIPSINGEFSREIRKAGEGSVAGFTAWLKEKDHRDFVRNIGIADPLVERLLEVLDSSGIGQAEKRRLMEQFVATYDLYSESRYLLSPLDLKSFLGSHALEGEYVGIFHFHNDAEPPSDADIQASGRDRQLIISLTESGFVLYDVVREKEKRLPVSVPGLASRSL